MTPKTLRRSAIASLALASLLIAAPAQAEDTETPASGACQVTDGTMSWGVKESFRSYISGTIANGEWETSDGAEYETPNFSWAKATGTIDPATGDGDIALDGTVHFTGHDGALDLTIANPKIEFEGDSAALLLDVRSTDTEGDVTVDEKGVWFGDIAIADGIAPTGDTITLTDLPTTLTNDGAKAFAGFYEGGAELDPITLTLDVTGCDAAAAPATPTETTEPAQAPTEQPAAAPAAAPVPWVPIGIGAAALLVIGITVGMLVSGRSKKPGAGAQGTLAGSDGPDPQGPGA